MLDLALFRKPSFTGVSVVAFSLSAGMFALFLYLTLYIQDVLGYSPLEAGLRFLPLTLLSFIVAPISARLSEGRVQHRVLMGSGLLLVGIGLVLMHGLEVGNSWTVLLPGFLIAGIGIGMTNPGIAAVAIGVVEPARAGMASGINSTFRQVGIATGVAALGAIFQSRVDSKLGDLLPQAPGAFSDAVSSGATESRRRLGPAAVPRAGARRRQPGVRRRAQRDPADRRRDRVRRQHRRLPARPLQRHGRLPPAARPRRRSASAQPRPFPRPEATDATISSIGNAGCIVPSSRSDGRAATRQL